MCPEIPAEITPADNLTLSGVFVLLPPFCRLILELESSELHIVLRPDIAALKMLVDISQPIIRIMGLRQLLNAFGWLLKN